MSRIIQLRRDAASSWTAVNPILTQGEFGYETDTNKFKIGNGVDDWNTLGYLFQGEEGGTVSYDDLSDLPTLFDGAYSSLTGAPTLATVATSGAYTDLSGTPTLATVATTGAYADITGTPSIPSTIGGSFQAVASGSLANGDKVVVNSDDSVSSVSESLSNATKSSFENNYGDTTEADNPSAGFMVPVPNTTKAILGGRAFMTAADGGNDTSSVVTHLVDVASDGTVTKVSPDYMGHLHAVNDTDQSSSLYINNQCEKPVLAYWDTTHNCLVFGYVRSGSSNDFYFNTATVSGNNITWGTAQKIASVNTDLIVNRSASYFRPLATAYNSTDNNAAVFFECNPTGGAPSGEAVPYIFSYNGTTLTATAGATAKITDIAGESGIDSIRNLAAVWCSWDNNYLLSWNTVVQDGGLRSRIKVASMSATGTISNVQSHYNDAAEYSLSLHRELIADDVANRVLYSYLVERQPGELHDRRHYKMLTISSGVITIPATASHEVEQTHLDDRNEYRTSMISSGVYAITKMTADEPGPYDAYQGYVSYNAYDLLYDGSTFTTRTPANGSSLYSKFNFVNSWGQGIYAQAVVNGSVITASGVYGTGQYGGNTFILSYIAGEISSNLTAENYVGISDGAYSNGATATIQSAGAVDDAQSGLTSGQAYYVQGDGTLSTTAGDPSVFAGLALSSTEILIAKDDSGSGDSVSSYNDLTDLPTLFDGAYSSLTGAPTLATVATSGVYTDLTGTPSIPSALTDIGITDGTANQVLTTDGSGSFTFTDAASSYGNTEVDTHLNTGSASANQILSWNGSDYTWVADQISSVGTSTVIAPVALANVDGTSGSGTGISYGSWNSGSGTLTFTFSSAQSDSNYVVMTDGEFSDDGRLASVSNKSTTGFEVSFYDSNGNTVTPSSFSRFAVVVYGSTPTTTVIGSGSLTDLGVTTNSVGTSSLAYNSSSGVFTYTPPDLSGYALTSALPSTLTDLNITDGTSNQVLTTDGSGGFTFETPASSGTSDVSDDTSPQLGGNLDVNGNDIVSTSNGDIDLDPDGSGNVIFKGNNTRGSGAFKLNCENNSHGITIKGPPHSANADYTLTLPNNDGTANQVLTTDGNGNLSFASAGGGAWSKLSTNSISSGSSSYSDTSILNTSSYSRFLLVIDAINLTGPATRNITMKLYNGSSYVNGGDVRFVYNQSGSPTVYNGSDFQITPQSPQIDTKGYWAIEISAPRDGNVKILMNAWYDSYSYSYINPFGGGFFNTSALTGFQLNIASPATFSSGQITVYGTE